MIAPNIYITVTCITPPIRKPHFPDSLLFTRRYLVGDFMVLNADSSIRGSEEFYPRIEELFDWLPYQSQWMEEHMRYPLYQSDEVIDRLNG